MEYQEIEALIALKESKNLEFKESTGQLAVRWKLYVLFLMAMVVLYFME